MTSRRSSLGTRLVNHASVDGAGTQTHAELERRLRSLESASPGGAADAAVTFVYNGKPVIGSDLVAPVPVRVAQQLTAAVAVMSEPPADSPPAAGVTVRIRRGSDTLVELTVPAGETSSPQESLATSLPLAAGEVLRFDVTNVPTGSQGPPGRHITVKLW